MKHSRTWQWILGLALIAGVAVVMWKLSRPTEHFAQPPVESGAPTASRRVIEPRQNGLPAQSDGAVAGAPTNNLPGGDLVTLVAARLREWEDQDDPELRDQRTQELETLLSGTNMIEIVQELPPDLMNFAFGLPSLQRWMASNPRAAADWISSHPDIAEARVWTIIQGWEQKDPAELQQYLAGLPEGEWKQQVFAALGYELLSTDPVEAIALASQMTPDPRQMGVLQLATTEWAKHDPVAASQWVSEMNDPGLRAELAGSVAVGYADIDPVHAAEWLIQSVRSPEVMDRSVVEIARAWAMHEPAAAGEWVARFSQGEGRQMALGSLVNIWGNRDRAALTLWIDGLTEGSFRTEAADLLATIPAALSTQ